LNTCVFPTETKQFPQRLACSSWDLADNKHVVGFSGGQVHAHTHTHTHTHAHS
jgi:hypothetical protein